MRERGSACLCEELRHGDLKRDGDKRVCFDHDPHVVLLDAAIVRPGRYTCHDPLIAHVRPRARGRQKTDQQVLALCPHTIHGSAHERRVSVDARERREDRCRTA